jgi:hypothetical protein
VAQPLIWNFRVPCPSFFEGRDLWQRHPPRNQLGGSNNTLLKRDGGFATQDAAKIAGRADAKKIRNSSQPGG